MNFKLILDIIGIALIACNIPAFIDWVGLALGIWDSNIIFSVPQVFPDIAIPYSIFLLILTAGLALYISGRKEFSNYVKGSKIVSGLLMFFGLIITVESLAFLGMATSFLSDIGSSWGLPLASRDLAIYLLIFVWCGLGFISGVLWLVDGAKVGEDKVLPLKYATKELENTGDNSV